MIPNPPTHPSHSGRGGLSEQRLCVLYAGRRWSEDKKNASQGNVSIYIAMSGYWPGINLPTGLYTLGDDPFTWLIKAYWLRLLVISLRGIKPLDIGPLLCRVVWRMNYLVNVFLQRQHSQYKMMSNAIIYPPKPRQIDTIQDDERTDGEKERKN